MKRITLAAAIAVALLVPQTSPARKKPVKCFSSSIHMTVSADGKGYIVTSAIVCTNGKLKLIGKRK